MNRRWLCLATAITILLLVVVAISYAGASSAATPVPDTALARPRPTVDGVSNIYIGCLHSAHTLYSDGRLQHPGELYSAFKPYWDWVATTDHDYAISAEEWRSTVENANAYNSKNFVCLIGYEWTSSPWGHLSVVFRGEPKSRTSGPASSSVAAYDSPRKLYTFLSAADGLAAFAHPALSGFPIDFTRESDYRNDAVASLVCMFGFRDRSHWSTSWDYADGRSIPVPDMDNVSAGGWVKTALDRGYHLGFVGELDLHQKEIAPMSYRYTGVVGDGLTREGVFEALKRRHTYAVRSPSGLGKRILLRADAGNHLMGDIFTCESNTIKVTLRGKTDLAQFTLVNLFVNGKIAQSRNVSGRDLLEKFSFTLADGDNYTFFEVKALSADSRVSQAFTSPMYVTAGKGKR